MFRTPGQQMAVSTVAPVLLSTICFALCQKKIKETINKLKIKDSKVIKKMLLPLAFAMYASAGYASFRIYLRSTFLGPPMSGTSKALACCANKALVSYCSAVLFSLLWMSKFGKCAMKGMVISAGFLASSLFTVKKFYHIDKMAAKAFIPLTAFSVVSTMISIEFCALSNRCKKSTFSHNVMNFIGKNLNFFVSKAAVSGGSCTSNGGTSPPSEAGSKTMMSSEDKLSSK